MKFISSWKKFYPINLIKVTKIENKNASVQNKKRKAYLQYRYYLTELYTYFLVGITQKEREEDSSVIPC